MAPQSLYVIENGDGDPEWLHPRLLLERVFEKDAPDHVKPWGALWLVRVVSGPKAGTFLALTPRGSTVPIDDHLAHSGRFPPSVSVVLHRVERHDAGALRVTEPGLGMTVLTPL